MNKNLTLTPANDNIFLNLGFDPIETTSLKIRTDLIIDLQELHPIAKLDDRLNC